MINTINQKVDKNHEEIRKDIMAAKPSYASLTKEMIRVNTENAAKSNTPEKSESLPKKVNCEKSKIAGETNGENPVITVQDEDNEVFAEQKEKRGFRSRKKTHKDVVGVDTKVDFGANVDIFISNINKDIKAETIVDHIKSTKVLEIVKIEKMSHPDARTQSFCISVKAKDKDTAINSKIWPYGVKVRVFRHKRHEDRRGDRSPQFQ